MSPQDRDQLFSLAANLVNDAAVIGFTQHDVVEPHLPDRGRAGINQRRDRATQQFKQLQPGGCRHHQLAISSQQRLMLEPLDDFGARGRCANALRFFEALPQRIIFDEPPRILHGVDKRAFVVARRRLRLFGLNTWPAQCRCSAIGQRRQCLFAFRCGRFIVGWIRVRLGIPERCLPTLP